MIKRFISMVLVVLPGSVVCFIASYLFARILLVLNNGFGKGDLPAFAYWTGYFAIGLILPALLFSLLLRNFRLLNRAWLGILLGGLAGFGWTVLNLMLLGPWFGAWSFGVLYCWIFGGAAGIFSVAILGKPRVRLANEPNPGNQAPAR